MIIQKKLTKIGSGHWLLVPETVRAQLNLVEGNLVSADIYKVAETDKNIVSFKCSVCLHEYDKTEDEDTYCTACGNSENIEVLDKTEWDEQ